MPMFSSKNRLVFFLIIFFLFANAHIVLAEEKECNGLDPTATIDPTYIVKCVLNKLGISDETIADTTGSLDVARFKKQSPEVSITFTPSNPTPGEKVTASAQPMYFGNPTESLYFTWYLQMDICKEENLSKGNNKTLCDLNDDGDVDIEDFKIKAMRIYANDGFEWDALNAYATHTDEDSYRTIAGGDDQQDKNNECYFYDTKTGKQNKFKSCFHLFPDTNGHGIVGEEPFGNSEEEFWHTDPNNPDTAGTGHLDEANVAGLGAKEFSWNYQSGDQLGVVIEGVSVDATQTRDSSYKIMWAFLNNTCPKDYFPVPEPPAENENIITNSEKENIDNFNKCLLKNMTSPIEGGGANEKIEVSLSASPENPVNDKDASGDNADWINIVSTIENSNKPESLDYTWSVYKGDTADVDGNWGSVLPKADLLGVGQTMGAGIPNLKFKANFPSAPKYLKVRLNVSETVTTGKGGTRKGRTEIIIPLSSFNEKLSVFNTSVDSSQKLAVEGEELCKIYAGNNATTLVDAAICQVAPDEIIAVKANIIPDSSNKETLGTFNFLWTLNDQPLSYRYDTASVNSNFKPGDLIYFPVLAAKDSTLNLSLVATSTVSGRKISLTKTFLVSEPAFKISSLKVDGEVTSKPKLLGNYLDLDGKKWPDFSQTEFLAKQDASLSLAISQLAALPLPLEKDFSLRWYLNGAVINNETGRTLSLTPPSNILDSFSISVEGLYTQDLNTKKALNRYWGVAINDFREQKISQKIDFSLVNSAVFGEVATEKDLRQKVLASFVSSVPAYFAFLFRITMTTFVLVFSIWIIFALFPQAQKND